jgi:hypothetical protein
MEKWVNGASRSLERHLNRTIKAQTRVTWENGSGRIWMYTKHSPIMSIDAVSLWDNQRTSETVLTPATDIVFDSDAGKIQLVNGEVFKRGFQNVAITYRAGWDGEDLAPFEDAVKELILIRWRAIGDNPLELVRSDNIGNNVSSTRFDPRRLPHIVQQTVYSFRRAGV